MNLLYDFVWIPFHFGNDWFFPRKSTGEKQKTEISPCFLFLEEPDTNIYKVFVKRVYTLSFSLSLSLSISLPQLSNKSAWAECYADCISPEG